jgi:hypothetical protein
MRLQTHSPLQPRGYAATAAALAATAAPEALQQHDSQLK